MIMFQGVAAMLGVPSIYTFVTKSMEIAPADLTFMGNNATS